MATAADLVRLCHCGGVDVRRGGRGETLACSREGEKEETEKVKVCGPTGQIRVLEVWKLENGIFFFRLILMRICGAGWRVRTVGRSRPRPSQHAGTLYLRVGLGQE